MSGSELETTMLDLLHELALESRSKIVLLVADGLGGLPREPGGPTELEAAATPNLDALVARNVCGLSIPVAPGITPGSGPGHLGLFGYDPREHTIGRGVVEALGIDFNLGSDDVAARGNFCTCDAAGVVTDRRAGRIDSAVGRNLVQKLRAIRIDGVELFVEPVKDYRFVLVIRGPDLCGDVDDTDPGMTGVAPHKATARDAASQATAAKICGRRVGVGATAPIGAADLRAVPDVDRVAAAQEEALVALAAVPSIQPRRGRGAVPHHQVDPARVHRNLVLDVAVIAVQRLRVGVAEDCSAHREGPLLLDRDRCAGFLPLTLRCH
jgi:hypothetical protein